MTIDDDVVVVVVLLSWTTVSRLHSRIYVGADGSEVCVTRKKFERRKERRKAVPSCGRAAPGDRQTDTKERKK